MGIDTYLTICVLIVGIYMAWSIGANDVANAMGTSIGSGALTLRQAVIIAGILEFAGALLLGARVSKTMQSGLIDPSLFQADYTILFFGMFAALLSTAIWLQIASYFGWPVSTTHAIVGAILGFGIIIAGVQTIQWGRIGSIALSWIISPGISAIISYAIFSLLQKRILYALNPVQATRKLIPLLVFLIFFTFIFSILFQELHNISIHLNVVHSFLIACGAAAILSFISYFLLQKNPHITASSSMPFSASSMQQLVSMNKAMKHLQRLKLASKGQLKEKLSTILHESSTLRDQIQVQTHLYQSSSEYRIVEKLFSYLQIISACFVAFAHGANDVANAIGPMSAAIDILRTGKLSPNAEIPTWILMLGGAGIILGLATWGWRVIETVGKKITELTPTRGFSAEFGAAITIIVASKAGLPISTTHCIVGAVLGVGFAKGISGINLRVLRDIALSWIVTIPSSAILCVIIFYMLQWIFSSFL